MINETSDSRNELIEMAKNLCSRFHTKTFVYWFVKAIPRRGRVVDSEGAAQYQGQSWAQLIFTCSPQKNAISSGDKSLLPDGVSFIDYHHHSEPSVIDNLKRDREALLDICKRVADWLDNLKKQASKDAETCNFPSLREALIHDSRNFDATSKSIRKVIAQVNQ